VFEQARGNHATDADDRADRQVDPLGHYNKRHAHRDDRVDRGLQHDVEEIGGLVEIGRQQGEDHEKRGAADGDTALPHPIGSKRLRRQPRLRLRFAGGSAVPHG
jgi:hypothetical protein